MNKDQKTRRSRGFAWLIGSGLLTMTAALLMTACATDGYDDDERFDNGMSGQALTSPSAENITIAPSADGKSQTISWPVVMGAGGYLFSFYDVTKPDEPIVKDSLVDGCSVTVKREEDMYYRVDLRAKGSAKSNRSLYRSTPAGTVTPAEPISEASPAVSASLPLRTRKSS